MSNPFRLIASALLDSQQSMSKAGRARREAKLELSRTELGIGHLNESVAREIEKDQATLEAYAPAVSLIAQSATKGNVKSGFELAEKGIVEPAIAHAAEKAAIDSEAADERTKSARKTANLLEREAGRERESLRKDGSLIERIVQLAGE